MENQIQRIDNILYGPAVEIEIDRRGLGRTIFDKMKQYRNRVLQIDAQNNQIQTYEEVNRKCIRIALEMKRQGIKEKDIVMICSANTMDSLILIYSTLYLNAITVTLDPTVSLIDSVHLLKTVTPKFIFAVESAIELLENSLVQMDINPKIIIIGDDYEKYAMLSEFLVSQPDEDQFIPDYVNDVHSTAIIFFSSGTTGLPKAVCGSHYALLKSWTAASFDMIDSTTALYYISFSWIQAIVYHSVGLLRGGKRIVAEKFTPETFLKYVEEYKITFSHLTAVHVCKFNEQNTRNYNTDSLRELRLGGRFIPPEQIQNLRKYFPNTRIYTLYGLTESCSVISTFSKFSHDLARDKLRSCGVPFINTKVKIADLESGRSLGPYQKGEICASSECLFSGYYNLNSDDRFDHEGFLKTGDIGYYDEDNCLYFCYRVKEVFTFQNSYVIPSCVEHAVYQHPAVLETVVIGIPHETDQHHPFALVVLKDGYCTSEDELLNFVNERVEDKFKLRAGVKIVKRIPKTCTGKIPRQVIKQLVLTRNLSQFGDTNFKIYSSK